MLLNFTGQKNRAKIGLDLDKIGRKYARPEGSVRHNGNDPACTVDTQ
jgi:hypothetical protein